MDDLSGLDWSASSSAGNKQQPMGSNTGANYSSFSSSSNLQSLSGRSTPLSSGNFSRPSSTTGAKLPTKSSAPATDSFSGLVSFGSSKTAASKLSLQEQAKMLQEEKQRKEEERRKKEEEQFGGKAGDSFWNNLGGPSRVYQKTSQPFAPASAKQEEAEEDILAAFSAAAPVDRSSHFSPSEDIGSERHTPDVPPVFNGNQLSAEPELDDDIFGLGGLSGSRPRVPRQEPLNPADDDDDVLGLLGKPISELPPRRPEPEPHREPEPHGDEAVKSERSSAKADPRDQAIAELVDMGFPADKARRALAETDTGINVQAAVGLLLNQAHEESRQKSRGSKPSDERSGSNERVSRAGTMNASFPRRDRSDSGSVPAWARNDGRSNPGQNRQGNRSPAHHEKDVAQYASEFGNQLFKSANSLWKSGTKRVQQAVAELQHDGDPNQPRWMREAQLEAEREKRLGADQNLNEQQRSPAGESTAPAHMNVTDEALMLESGDNRPQRHQRHVKEEPKQPSQSRPAPREQSPRWAEAPVARESSHSRPRQAPQPQIRNARDRISRQEVEEQTAQAYVSPARRKKTTPTPAREEMDIFSDAPQSSTRSDRAPAASPLKSNNPFLSDNKAAATTQAPTSLPSRPRPKGSPRNIPSASPSALSSSASYRAKGTEAFKRGDYASAQESYSQALSPLPQTHPMVIVVLCNRALTNLKVGDPKAAVADSDTVFSIIGPSNGEDEVIDLGGSEGQKPMKDYYGKALMRKAEALEQMEKWADAGKVWRQAVEAGVGGATSIQGRNRCDKAAGGGSTLSSTNARRPPPQAKKTLPVKTASALDDLAGNSSAPFSGEAVTRLREANIAAEKADDEKFALTDAVDARLSAWRAGKSDNLRALLGSLDAVLWAEAGWKKVGMHELVIPQKVKITYMKGIAKVHPDKLPQTATTEQKMISAAVFSTLNEAWDKFKKENGL